MKKIMVFLLTVIFIFAYSGCTPTSSNGGDITPTDLEELAESEVMEYEGLDLSSILDFRDNSIKGPQYIDIEEYRLTIDGLVENPTELTYDEVLAYQSYSKVVRLRCVEGWSVDILWEGILLEDIFADRVILDDANTVIFYSYDGYSTSLPLSTILEKNILIAYKMNGLTLPPELGYPFQLVAESKYGYKWAKWITHIELSNDPNYRGYWEQRGYSNDADVN